MGETGHKCCLKVMGDFDVIFPRDPDGSGADPDKTQNPEDRS